VRSHNSVFVPLLEPPADSNYKRASRNPNPGLGKFDPVYVIGRKPDLIAAWIKNADFDLKYGLRKRRYVQAGYQLAYFLYMGRQKADRIEAIIDVRELSDEERRKLFRAGYLYAVVERTG
jgi:hypothetical protein